LTSGATPIDAKIFTSFDDMADSVDFDAVYLCLPPFVHGEIDHKVIDLGKAIFIEKPLAVEMAPALEIAAHIKEKGVLNAVGHQMRNSPLIGQATDLLKGHQIGMASAVRLSGLPGTPWWRVQEKSGGMLIEQHVHAVDLMRVLVGEIETVYAVGNTLLSSDVPGVNIFDVNAVTVRFANGAPGIVGNSCAAPAGAAIFPPHHIQVVTREFVADVNPRKTVIHRTDAEPEVWESDHDGTLVMNQLFIDAVRDGNQTGITCSYDDALRSFAVTVAAQKSAESGQVITVNDLLAPSA
jgi:predicted dehydrogenase